ncbi:hypothetical protein [Plantactinospora sp. WMMB782]|uniref:hypothetical protein n=1 Tax=Plantactinospora sp. WMMB782 TaxID=3404121 RepID=UPI003B92A32B
MNDFGVHLRDRIGAETLPPSRISATGLVAEGRRVRRRRRRLSVGAGAAVLAVLAGVAFSLPGVDPGPRPGPGIAAGTPSERTPLTRAEVEAAMICAGVRLALPPEAIRGAVDTGSPDGRYLAGSYSTAESQVIAVRWDGDRVERIPVDGWASANGVDDRGVVVGSAFRGGEQRIAWAYVDGKVVELPVPAGHTGAEARGINARGEVAGVVYQGSVTRAAIWRGTTATARVDVLTGLPGGRTFATGISDSGVTAGVSGAGGDAYRWDASGRGSLLPRPAGLGRAGAHGVRGELAYGVAHPAGAAAGTGTPDGAPGRDEPGVAVVWDLRTGAVTEVGSGVVGAVNGRDHLVLNRRDGSGVRLRYPDGRLRHVTADNAGNPSGATISEDGTRIGGRSDDWPIRWTCPS